ncbi:MAG: hypothetical protein V4513_06095 [Pseudomonadota bacterium]
MSDGPEWFAPKRFGFGAGFPISWQGWALTIGFIAIVWAAVFFFRDRPLVTAAVLLPLVIAFMIIAAKTTRGGWHWRWGKRD